MAKFELNIYGENDEIVKQYSTNICSWGVFIQAAEMSETLQEKSAVEQISAVGEILKAVFRGLTSDELMCADSSDVMNTFNQIVSGGQKIKGANSKNA
jgi:hypothetical protein